MLKTKLGVFLKQTQLRNVVNQEQTKKIEIKLQNRPVRIGKFYSNNYIKYDSNGDRNKIQPIKE